MFKLIFSRLLLGVSFLIILLTTPLRAATTEKPIKFADLTWESGQFTTALLQEIIEKGYGYPTEIVSGAGVAVENGLIQNDIQVIAEVWMGRSPVLAKGIKEGKVDVLGNTLKGGTVQGWYIPEYLHKQYPDLKTVQDLPKFAHLFSDSDNPKMGHFLNCPTGWVCEMTNARLLKNFGLTQTYENQHPGTGAALDSAIASAFAQKKPILFYYWQPSALMAQYSVFELKFPPYNAQCWQEILNPESHSTCVSDYPVSELGIAVSAPFVKKYPALLPLLRNIQFNLPELNQQIYEMHQFNRTGREQALHFLKSYPQRWQRWVSPQVAERLEGVLFTKTAEKADFFPKWSMENTLNKSLRDVVQDYGGALRALSNFLKEWLWQPAHIFFSKIPAWLFILAVSALLWHSTRRWTMALLGAGALYLIGALGLWAAAMQTVALMLVSIVVTISLGLPLGIGLAKTPRLYRGVLPLLDIAQTMPSFVYLIPVLMLFGLGEVPAIFACLVYAIVPLIRLTVLGIRQIPRPLIEAGQAFGSSRWQLLKWVVLPAAKPQIMAGINQTVMMSLSMVVLASMIGASGLGQIILQAIQTLNVGQGLQAGGAIVILAIIVDRITQGYGRQPNNDADNDERVAGN